MLGTAASPYTGGSHAFTAGAPASSRGCAHNALKLAPIAIVLQCQDIAYTTFLKLRNVSQVTPSGPHWEAFGKPWEGFGRVREVPVGTVAAQVVQEHDLALRSTHARVHQSEYVTDVRN